MFATGNTFCQRKSSFAVILTSLSSSRFPWYIKVNGEIIDSDEVWPFFLCVIWFAPLAPERKRESIQLKQVGEEEKSEMHARDTATSFIPSGHAFYVCVCVERLYTRTLTLFFPVTRDADAMYKLSNGNTLAHSPSLSLTWMFFLKTFSPVRIISVYQSIDRSFFFCVTFLRWMTLKILVSIWVDKMFVASRIKSTVTFTVKWYKSPVN